MQLNILSHKSKDLAGGGKSPPYINLLQNPVLPFELYISLKYTVYNLCCKHKLKDLYCQKKKKKIDCCDQIDLSGFHQKNDKGLKLF